MTTPTFPDIEAAAERIRPYIHRTPVLTSGQFDGRSGASVFFKCENFQKGGAFKARGAHNAVFSLSDDAAQRGVVTHSSGNHGAALAMAAKTRGIPAYIVMPRTVISSKKQAVAAYGGIIIECEPTLSAREAASARILLETGGTMVHPYDDARVIAGQGTAALELLEDFPDLDVLLTPVGGGGLLGGSALVAKSLPGKRRVIGVEPELADDTFRSFRSGQRVSLDSSPTIADGLRGSVGVLNFQLLKDHVDDIVTVSEAAIISATRLVWERMKIIVEPSGAVPLAAILDGRLDVSGHRVGIILSGGNVDLDALPWIKAP